MTINLEYYKVFYYVAVYKSITIAAEQLSISQPAVSQSLKQLEQLLGVSLFHRTSKGVRLTQEGQVLFQYVEQGYQMFELAELKLKQQLNLESGEIRIGASDMTLQFYLLPYLEKFHETYPGIQVRVTNAPTPETMKLLREGKIDFGVISTPFAEQKHLNSFPVRDIEDVFVAGRKFIQYKNKMLDLNLLEELPLILLEKNTSTRTYMDQFLDYNHVQITPEFELATSDMIVQFALRNLGVGCVVKDFCQTYLEEGLLFELRFKTRIPKRQFCVVTSENQTLSRAATNLLQLIRENRKD